MGSMERVHLPEGEGTREHRFLPTVLITRYRSTYYTYNVARETKITRSMLLDAMFPVDRQRGVCG